MGWGMPAGSTHWKCRLRRGDKRFTVYFSMGPAHSREPEVADVLDCLASDASGIENAKTFEDWAGEYGYDTDSRRAERTYRICVKQAEKLKQFLGDDLFDQLVWNTERL
jgi:hypothetical protein